MIAFAPSAIGWAKTALRTIAGPVLAYPLQAALIVSLVACGWLWMGKRDALAERDKARAELIAQAKAYKAAQQEAERKALAERAATETLSRKLAHAADQNAADLDAISRRALSLRAKADRCPSSGTVAAAVPDDTEGPAGTDTGGVYTFTAAEADALRRHEVRSVTCEGWARGLIDAGLAVGE